MTRTECRHQNRGLDPDDLRLVDKTVALAVAAVAVFHIEAVVAQAAFADRLVAVG